MRGRMSTKTTSSQEGRLEQCLVQRLRFAYLFGLSCSTFSRGSRNSSSSAAVSSVEPLRNDDNLLHDRGVQREQVLHLRFDNRGAVVHRHDDGDRKLFIRVAMPAAADATAPMPAAISG